MHGAYELVMNRIVRKPQDGFYRYLPQRTLSWIQCAIRYCGAIKVGTMLHLHTHTHLTIFFFCISLLHRIASLVPIIGPGLNSTFALPR